MMKQIYLVMFELVTTVNPGDVSQGQLQYHNRVNPVQEWFIDYAQPLGKEDSSIVFTPEWLRCEAFKKEMERRTDRDKPAIFECVTRDIGQ